MYDIMLSSIAYAPHHIRSDIDMLFFTVSKYLNMSVSHREGQCVSNSLGFMGVPWCILYACQIGSSGGSKGDAPGAPPPHGPKMSRFHAVFGKF